jgi:hypothetical protein
MKLILLLTILLCLSTCSVQADDDDPIFAASELANVVGNALDLSSTQRCLGAGRCVETNPFLLRFDDPLTFAAAKFGIAGFGLWATRKLHASHPVWASVINFGIGGAFSAIAIRNTRIGK